MDVINRDFCIFTRRKDLKLIRSFPKFPVFMGCVEQPEAKDIVADMNWYISAGSGSLQLNPLIPLELVYPAQHNEAVGRLWTMHHQQFAEFIAEFDVHEVFEIGGANAIVARNFLNLRPGAKWTLVEPNPKVAPEAGIQVIQGFFDDRFSYDGTFDAVVHSHLFEHVYDPRQFIEHLKGFVPVGKMHIFTLPNLMHFLKNCYTNCLNFEHTCFLIEPYIDTLLARNGFEIVSKRYFQDHSVFYATRRIEAVQDIAYPNLYEQNSALFRNFLTYHENIVADMNRRLESESRPVYLFGAHIFSQFLIAFGLNTRKIVAILDNGPQKIGKRLYGTSLKVYSPKVLKDKGENCVILKTGMYNEEIKAQILQDINEQTIFWE